MSFDTVIENIPNELKDTALEVRKLLLDTDKKIEEHIYGGAKVKMALYSIGGTDNVLYGIGTGKDHIKLYLHHTDKPDADVAGLKLEGKGKHAKTVKLTAINKENAQQLKTAFSSIRKVSGY